MSIANSLNITKCLTVSGAFRSGIIVLSETGITVVAHRTIQVDNNLYNVTVLTGRQLYIKHYSTCRSPIICTTSQYLQVDNYKYNITVLAGRQCECNRYRGPLHDGNSTTSQIMADQKKFMPTSDFSVQQMVMKHGGLLLINNPTT